MTDMNTLFIMASKKRFRFESSRGELTTEQLWELPLLAANGFCLDAVARATSIALKGATDESFVETRSDPRKGELEAMLEVVKFVIASKQADAARQVTRAARAEERRKLLDAIAAKDDAALSTASKEELVERLGKLDEDADPS